MQKYQVFNKIKIIYSNKLGYFALLKLVYLLKYTKILLLFKGDNRKQVV